ncbi:DcuS/MalK family sensor histidine kinase [Alkaliphilus transvaalensis]|uniref:DcuS/MalK family sensor histidine kinase n=1 Tax=Alkaliphilus transvaalensis TaxID=114628 RepID=UPI00068622AD|nr:DcuS/MalK family sensor histidine kinase [Alkaliphilus transvaalensis]
MRKLHLKLQVKIIILVTIIVMVSIYTTVFIMNHWVTRNIQKEVEINIMNIAQIVANSPNVITGLSQDSIKENEIQPYVEKILANSQQVEIIVVANMEGIRYAHPNPERVGQSFVGGDELRVISEGEKYISEATGTLGHSIRAFVPIYRNEGEQIGFVMTGTLTQSIERMRKQSQMTIVLSSFVGLFFGIIGAFLLSTNIKRILLGLEPEQISKLYLEKEGILESIHEGIIAVDDRGKITLVNESAIKLLQVADHDVIGKDVLEIFPTSRLPEIIQTGIAEYDREQVINQTIIITNRIPIKEGEKIVGAIATFRDKTMVTRLAEEVTGVKQIVESLRANTHEFMNKLHVILGLIEVNELEEAKKFIISTGENQQQIITLVMNKIKDPTIAGLLLGKFSRAKELGIHMKMDEESNLERRTDHISSNVLVTIIGNLLENAMEAVTMMESKYVDFSIVEERDQLMIRVKDNGVGIQEEHKNLLFNRGFTTKQGNRGVGLALVREIVENLGGYIEFLNEDCNTEFVVSLPKGEKK